MSTSNTSTGSLPKLAGYAYLSSLYFITVGVLYLWGYWSQFDVNILEYLTLAEVAKATAYPIASSFSALAMGVLIGEVFFGSSHGPSGGGRDTAVGRFLRRTAPYIGVGYAALIVGLWYFGPPEKWLVLSALIAIPVPLILGHSRFFVALIPHATARSMALLLLAMLPTFAYGQGRLRARDILNGTTFQYLLSPVPYCPSDTTLTPKQRLRFVGRAGSFLFFYEPTDTALAVVTTENVTPLRLRSFRSTSTPPRRHHPSPASPARATVDTSTNHSQP